MGEWSKEIREQIWDKYYKRCAYCGIYLNYEDLTLDHVIPIYRNQLAEQLIFKNIIKGENKVSNLYPCCDRCNYNKGDYTLEEWRSQIQIEIDIVKNLKHYKFLDQRHAVKIYRDPVVFYFEQFN